MNVYHFRIPMLFSENIAIPWKRDDRHRHGAPRKSPYFLPKRRIAVLHEINRFNPFAVFIDASRALVFSGEFVVSSGLVTFAVLSLVLLPIASKVFYVMEERIRD